MPLAARLPNRPSQARAFLSLSAAPERGPSEPDCNSPALLARDSFVTGWLNWNPILARWHAARVVIHFEVFTGPIDPTGG